MREGNRGLGMIQYILLLLVDPIFFLAKSSWEKWTYRLTHTFPLSLSLSLSPAHIKFTHLQKHLESSAETHSGLREEKNTIQIQLYSSYTYIR